MSDLQAIADRIELEARALVAAAGSTLGHRA